MRSIQITESQNGFMAKIHHSIEKLGTYGAINRVWVWPRDKIFGPLLNKIGILRNEASKCSTVEDFVDLAFSLRVSPLITIRGLQVREEITEMLKILAKTHPKVVCEIGTARGGTLYLISKTSPPDATIISIDLPSGPFGGGYPRWKISLYKSFASNRQKIHLIQADSHDPSTAKKVREILKGRGIDFLFIDGDHTYEGVKKDFELYSKFVRRGIIAIHDIVPGSSRLVGGVPKYWSEIKGKFRTTEIVKNWGQGGWGIGIVYLNDPLRGRHPNWCSHESSAR